MNRLAVLAACLMSASALLSPAGAAEFASRFPPETTRPWIGPEYWSNPLQDWQIAGGRLECLRPAPDRNVHVLTRRLGEGPGGFEMTVRLGLMKGTQGSAGFRVGIRGPLPDYRNALVFGRGINAGVTSDGTVFFGDPPRFREPAVQDPIELKLVAVREGEQYLLTLSARIAGTERQIGEVTRRVPAGQLVGNLALVSNFAPNPRGGQAPWNPDATYWFSDWKLRGEKIEAHEEERFGPILFALHTLDRGVMKMTAQMPPVGKDESQTVRLEIERDGRWRQVGQAEIDPLSRTATFRLADWDDDRDTPYRLVYAMTEADGTRKDYYYTGTVRRDPVDKEEIVVAGFTGHQDYCFPNDLLAGNVAKIDPDVLVFTGDQIYENNAGYGIVRTPVELAALDYLRKWYVFGWGFRDLMRDRVTLCLPDDHDVYQGNIWGEGGKPTTIALHDHGGYAMHPEWVNAIQRMHAAHHPDPYDPTPIEQGISVYYGPMVYGRISFAVIEDRKFKSGPGGKVNTWPGRPDHVKDPNFDPQSVDKPGLVLLGDRQLEFLRDWAADWRGADMKMVISQTIFANVANYHGSEQEYLVADLDSNGWPQTGRNRALEEMRRGFAFHLAGDQHLASIVHHGIESWRDAGFSFCVPSIAAGYPRAWHPEREGAAGKNRKPGMPPYTGDFLDGLGNHVTVYGVGNPEESPRQPPLERAHDKASGFGVVRLKKPTQKLTMECWRLLVDVADPKPGDQFPGWPMTIDMLDNYGRQAAAHLPTLQVSGLDNPVIQIVDETDGEVVYTLRVRGKSFRPKVFAKDHTYTVHVGDPDAGKSRSLKGLKPDEKRTLRVEF